MQRTQRGLQQQAGRRPFSGSLPLLIAHRGSTGPNARENTMAAFHAAVALRADFIETDIRRTRDGVLVLHHDAAIGTLDLCNVTFAEAQADAVNHPAPLARLEDLLLFANGKIGLNLELKESGYEEEIASLLRRHTFPPGKLVVTSFLDDALIRFRHSTPELPRGLLLDEYSSPEDLFPEHRLRAAGADFVVAHDSLLQLDFASRLTVEGFPVWAWTVNEPGRLAQLLRERGVQAIITDDVRLAQQERSRMLHA